MESLMSGRIKSINLKHFCTPIAQLLKVSEMSGNYSNDSIHETVIKVNDKEFFIDVKQNNYGVYVKLSERNRGFKNTIQIPLEGLQEITEALNNAGYIANQQPASIQSTTDRGDRKPRDRPQSNPEVSARSVFVTGLSYDTDEDSFFNFFSTVGNVVKVKINHHFVDGERVSKGSGLVEFQTIGECQRAITEFDGSELDGRSIRCRQDRVFEDRNFESNNNNRNNGQFRERRGNKQW